MARYLLDTNVCIRVLKGSPPHLVQRLRQVSPSQVGLSTVVKLELLYGARHGDRVAEDLRLLRRFFGAFESLPLDDRSAEEAGEIRQALVASGTPIGPYDLLIAATARANGLILVTHNTREFSRVPGLELEDWEA